MTDANDECEDVRLRTNDVSGDLDSYSLHLYDASDDLPAESLCGIESFGSFTDLDDADAEWVCANCVRVAMARGIDVPASFLSYVDVDDGGESDE